MRWRSCTLDPLREKPAFWNCPFTLEVDHEGAERVKWSAHSRMRNPSWGTGFRYVRAVAVELQPKAVDPAKWDLIGGLMKLMPSRS